MKKENQYGPANCMICGNPCDITEILNINTDEEEGWCYCKKCKIDTFIRPLTEEEIENNK